LGMLDKRLLKESFKLILSTQEAFTKKYGPLMAM